MTDDVNCLEEEARRLWGDSCTISITRWSDGSTQVYASRSRGSVRQDEPESYVERERLWPKEEGFVYERVIVRVEEVVDVLKRRGPR